MADEKTVKLKAPPGVTATSLAEVVDGMVEVTASQAKLLLEHGFTKYEEPIGTYRDLGGKIVRPSGEKLK
jgi:hypothetical protein